MSLQVCDVLVEFPAIHATNGIYHQTVVKMTRVEMRSYYDFKIGEFLLCKLETNDISLSWGQAIIIRK